MDPVPRRAFERLVGDALDALPEELGRVMENVAVVVEDRHPSENLLGLYEGVPLTVILRAIGLVQTGSEARRLIEQGGVRLDGEVMKDARHRMTRPSEPVLVQVGKRRFRRLVS